MQKCHTKFIKGIQMVPHDVKMLEMFSIFHDIFYVITILDDVYSYVKALFH
jgi:hypothetical protein